MCRRDGRTSRRGAERPVRRDGHRRGRAGRFDLTRLTAVPSHLVDEGLDPEVRSDLLFRTRLRDGRDAISFVFVEHQGKTDADAFGIGEFEMGCDARRISPRASGRRGCVAYRARWHR